MTDRRRWDKVLAAEKMQKYCPRVARFSTAPPGEAPRRPVAQGMIGGATSRYSHVAPITSGTPMLPVSPSSGIAGVCGTTIEKLFPAVWVEKVSSS